MVNENEKENNIPATVKKGGMVSAEMFDIKKVAEQARKETEKPDFMPTPEFLELFKVEKLHDIAVSLGELVEIFKTASRGVVPVQVTQKSVPVAASAPAVPTPVQEQPTPVQTQADSPRLTEVKDALKAFSDLSFDEATSAQFIKVKPTKRLENFGQVFAVIKQIGGIYVSAGKDSHFEVPKIKSAVPPQPVAPVQAPVAALTPAPVTQPVQSNVSRLDEVKGVLTDYPLSVEEKGELIIVKPTSFLGSENFAKVASLVRGMGGEYVSAGKESHFKIPVKKP